MSCFVDTKCTKIELLIVMYSHVLFFDASKAFDRVSHYVLFEKLIKQGHTTVYR
jgi:hypothetical protein